MATVLNRTTKQLIESANTPDYPTADWIHRPDLSAVRNVPVKYWKISGDTVSEMSVSEKQAVDDAEKAALINSLVGQYDVKFDAIIQGFLATLDELNAHALKINAILDAADNAVSLADFKTRVALITDYPQRTLQQFKDAVKSRLEA